MMSEKRGKEEGGNDEEGGRGGSSRRIGRGRGDKSWGKRVQKRDKRRRWKEEEKEEEEEEEDDKVSNWVSISTVYSLKCKKNSKIYQNTKNSSQKDTLL
jgi:hypothetical protein